MGSCESDNNKVICKSCEEKKPTPEYQKRVHSYTTKIAMNIVRMEIDTIY